MMTHIDTNSLKHFGINCALALLLGVLGIGIGIGASITKEWCDKNMYYGHWCWWDIAFDCLGIIVGAGIHAGIIYVTWV